MRKKCVMMLLIGISSILGACDADAYSQNGTETGEVADIQTSDMQAKSAADMFQERMSDLDCFVPVSGDYIYVISKQNETMETVSLMSFNPDGSMMQYVERYISQDFVTNGPYEAADFNVDEVHFFQQGDTIYVDVYKGKGESYTKQEVMQRLEEGSWECEDYYISQL